MSSSPRAQPQRRLSTESSGARWYYRSSRPSSNGHDLNFDLGRTRDRAVERSASSIRRDQLVGLSLADTGDLERHRHRGEPIRLGRAPRAFDRDVDAGHGNARVPRVHLDPGDAAGRHTGEERLAVREGIGLGPRRRIEDEPVSARLAPGAAEDAAAGGSHRVDLHVAHLDPSSEVLSAYSAIYHT